MLSRRAWLWIRWYGALRIGAGGRMYGQLCVAQDMVFTMRTGAYTLCVCDGRWRSRCTNDTYRIAHITCICCAKYIRSNMFVSGI